MKKKLSIAVCLCLITALLTPQFVCATINPGTITMYYPYDGQIKVREIEKSDYKMFKDAGWYDEPIQYVYSPDNPATIVPESEAYDMIRYGGWYSQPVQRLYAPDGRTEIVYKKDVSANLAVGWYTEPMTIMYSWDGKRTQVVPTKDVKANEAVGWFTKMPLVTMWSWDGTRTQLVPINEVEANEAVGWCYGKPVHMYADGGEEMIVGEKRVETYKNLNWSTEPFVTMYAAVDGSLNSIMVPQSQVAANEKVGWSLTRPKANYQFNLQTAKNKAYECLKSIMKRPSTLEVYSVNAYDSTDSDMWDLGYIVYTICYDCSAMNGYGDYSRNTDRIKVQFSIYSGEYFAYPIN